MLLVTWKIDQFLIQRYQKKPCLKGIMMYLSNLPIFLLLKTKERSLYEVWPKKLYNLWDMKSSSRDVIQ